MFPEVDFDVSKFVVAASMLFLYILILFVIIIIIKWRDTNERAGNYWRDKEKRKQFFERFAKRSGFDALVADNWYSISPLSISAQKVIINHF